MTREPGQHPGFVEVDSYNATPSPGLAGWLAERRVSLAFTTGNRLMLVGLDTGGSLFLAERTFDGATGLAATGSQTMFLAARWQLWRLENALPPGVHDRDGHDRRFLAQTARTTGFVGIYDIAIDSDERPLFANTLFNCVARLSERANFTAVWTPPFISSLVSEDRCHLTGLALDGGQLAYVTCAAATDVEGGWREHVHSGGVVVDARSGEILTAGVSLPHSPRIQDGGLYVAAAGTGELLAIDRDTGAAERVASVPALARGLAFVGGEAILGCSRIPDEGAYATTSVRARLDGSGGVGFHGLAVVDIERGTIVHSLVLHGASGDVFAVAALPDAVYPSVTDSLGELREVLSIGPVEELA